ncbi:MAG: Crp/Fnr family transcriptional regulator [Rhodospirillales bacterium]|nr:MAG: Crp/Fnr family transcriptional regulator [Rhodospirillales bacterium]
MSTSRLKGVGLFEGLSDTELDEIEARCHWHQLGGDSIVFDKESDTLEVYFVIEGSVRVLSYSPYAREKREVTLANFVAGEYFGELAALDGKPRSAKVVTSEPSLLASLEGPAFRDSMIHHPKLALRVTLRLADIIRRLDSRVTELSTLSEPERVYTELLHLAKPDNKKPGQYVIADMPKHKDLASWTGTSTDTVAQVVGELARDGILERRNLGMVIRDFERLRLMARAR